MKTKTASFLTGLLLTTCLLQQCSTPSDNKDKTSTNVTPGLKHHYKEYFPVGVAVSPGALKQSGESSLILQHFNSMTAENVMKMGPIHPEENQYNWEPADQIVNFADTNQMLLRGHTLCWHNQTPEWLFADENGDDVSKEVLLDRLKSHIEAVVTRYKGKIYAWDVVNEAVSDQSGEFLRNSRWMEIIGEDYIQKAFEFAHAADPEAKLFYNDYNVINPDKRSKIYTLIKGLLEKGVPVHGVGIQGHWSIYEPTRENLRETIETFENLGILVQVTELDVSVYPKEHSAREGNAADENDAFTAEQEQKQIEQYKMIFDLFREKKDVLTSVTFWNISDKHSWLDNFPVRGRKDYPLLFDQELKPKKAYHEVIDFSK